MGGNDVEDGAGQGQIVPTLNSHVQSLAGGFLDQIAFLI